MCRRGPLTFADDGQSGAVNDEVPAGARAGAPKREGEMLTASRARGVIGGREIDAQHPADRCQDALGLTQRYVEDETERQGGFDGEIGILELPAPPADASRCPRGDRVRREPEGDVASPHEGSVVLGPVPDAIRCRVLRMHSRLHIEIMTRRRSRWSTCRPLLAHRAESAHQRRTFHCTGLFYRLLRLPRDERQRGRRERSGVGVFVLQHRQGFDRLAGFFLGKTQFVELLQVEPEFRTGPEEVGQP